MSNHPLNLKYLIEIAKRYKWEMLLSVCLFSNLYPDLSPYLYYVLWIGFMYAAMKMNVQDAGERGKLTIAMIVLIAFSTLINMAIMDYRWVMMCVILYITLYKTSYRFFLFKEHFLFVSLFGYVFTGVINNYAHRAGINYQLFNWRHINEEFTLDFSGFTNNPMWLSAACGIGIIFLSFWMNRLWDAGKKIGALMLLPLIFLTLQTLVWGGSRSALGLSIGASLLLIWLSNKNIGKTILIFGCLAVLATIITPILLNDSERMQTKLGGFNLMDQSGKTSRSALWYARLEEFESSPIWGIGFGVTGIGEDATSGRAETGSGWLTVLSQTGITGLILVLLLIKRAVLPLKILRGNSRMALYSAILAFLCLHTMFEAYLFQSGWYLCFVMWLIVSVLDDYRKYHKVSTI